MTATLQRPRTQTWLPTAGKKTLAALRIASGVAVLLFVSNKVGFGLPPEELWVFYPGTGWLSFLPASDLLFDVALAGTAVAGVAVLAGWHYRPAAWVALAGVFYTGWMTTLTGKVDHGHHIMWILAIVAVSPAANIWAVRREDRAGSYQWPVMSVMILIGLVYFGAGLKKLMSAGLAWGWSDNLANKMLWLSWEKGTPVHEWLIDWPIAGKVLGVGALVFELGFLVLILHPKTRRLWPAGLVFHWGTWWLLGIPFLTLQVFYVVFLSFDSSTSPPNGVQRRLVAGLLAVVAVFSVAGIERAWPVAAYPSFEGIQARQVRTIVVDGQPPKSLPAATIVGAHRITPLIFANMGDKEPALLAWLDAESVGWVSVDLQETLVP